MRTLVVTPHLDDESISCGGLIQKRLSEKGRVHVAVIYGRVYDYGRDDGTAVEMKDFLEALDTLDPGLGQMSYTSLKAREGEPAQVGYYSILEHLEGILRAAPYDEVIVPAGDDLNQDHRFLNHVCKIALRPFNLGSVDRILEFFALDGTHRQPTWLESLSKDQLLTKQRAIGMYRREAREGYSPRSPANVEAQARVWGSMIGEEFAEGYRVVLERH